MKYSKSLQIRFRIALSVVQRALSKYTILKAGMRESTSEKTCACCATVATGNFITYPVKRVCPKGKCSTLKDYAIRFSGRPERWPASAIAIVSLIVVSIFLTGHLLGEAIESLWSQTQ